MPDAASPDLGQPDADSESASATPQFEKEEAGFGEPHLYDKQPMVGLGGSAGAVSGLQSFFKTMPPDSGMVFVVIMHLSAEHESTLPQVLQSSTGMKVLQARNGVQVEPNHVYVIPPGKSLTAMDGTLRLSDLKHERGSRMAVDLFFRTLADTHGPHAAAIVLSGANGDGAIGIKRIKEHGGLTVAQDPDEATHSTMPQTAIDTGMVDWVLAVSQMPQRLQDYFQNERKLRLPPDEAPEPPAAENEREAALREILNFLRARTGRDFSDYKRATILRRISRRMQVNGLDELQLYLNYLRTHAGEVGALLQDLLISVTNFFRDREAFEALEARIVDMFRDKAHGDAVRVWVAGCATGEEAYSIAILLHEYARKLEAPPILQIFATDLDETAIQTAREAFYPDAIAADVSEERLRRFFAKENRGYRLRREIRESVLFALHDLLKDSPFSRLDLISCRNLLIYLNRDAQRRALETFHFSLRPTGRLFLGTSETVDEGSSLFDPLDKKNRLFEPRSSVRGGLPVPIGPSTLMRAVKAQERAKAGPITVGRAFTHPGLPKSSKGQEIPRVPWEELHFRLLERLAPPSLIIDRDQNIVHLSESSGRFLHFNAGEPTTNVLRLINPALRLELRAALFRATQSNAVAVAGPITVEVEGKTVTMDLQVSPASEIASDHLLIVFSQRSGTESLPAQPPMPRETEPAVRHLEQEIEQLKVRLRDTVEQYEASTEELKSSNEELQAMNEELRSATEELETSREELQSVNEEVTTVNHELKGKVDQLAHTNSDLHNLMASTAIATIFLDRSLQIMRYTPTAVGLFRLIPGDLGRPLTDLQHRLDYPQLSGDAERVLESLVPIEREVSNVDGGHFLARLLPYRTQDDHIGGVVLTFVEITALKKAEAARQASEVRYHTLFTLMDEAFVVQEAIHDEQGRVVDFRYIECNPAFARHTGLGEVHGKTVRGVLPEIEPLWIDKLSQVLRSRQAIRFQAPLAALQRWFDVFATPIDHPEGDRLAILFTDITERRRSQEIIREIKEKLQLIIENAREYAIFSTDLHRRITTWNSGAERLLGFTEGEVIGLSADLIFTDEDRAAHAPQAEAELAQTRGLADNERWHLRKDGSRFWGSGGMMAMHNNEGTVVGFVKIFRDQTRVREAQLALEQSRQQLSDAHNALENRVEERTVELREANAVLQQEIAERTRVETALAATNEALNALVRACPLAIISLDAAGAVRIWNPAAERILGWKAKDILGRSTPTRPESAGPGGALHPNSVLCDHKGSIAWETRWRRKDGALLDVTIWSAAQRDRSGNYVSTLSIVADTTEKRRPERALAEAQDREQRRIGQDLHDGHCQVLFSIALKARVLAETLQAAGVKEATEAGKIGSLIAAAIDEARGIARGLHPAGLESGGLAPMLDELAASVAGTNCTVKHGKPPQLENNDQALHLYRIAQEAVSNAIRHAHAKNIALSLGASGSNVTLEIADDGSGFDVQEVGVRGGTIGLDTMRYRAHALGGTLEILSSVGGGTTVRCIAPAAARTPSLPPSPGRRKKN